MLASDGADNQYQLGGKKSSQGGRGDAEQAFGSSVEHPVSHLMVPPPTWPNPDDV